jgi:c-di-GMP-binding flagellar brake protein YcgR
MKKGDQRNDDRYDVLGLNMVAEYSLIPSGDSPGLSQTEGPATPQEYNSALVRNISDGGICLSIENEDLDAGREIVLFVTVSDPEESDRSKHVNMEFVGRVIWISEDTAGYRVGLKFTEVPDDFSEGLERVIEILGKEQHVL